MWQNTNLRRSPKGTTYAQVGRHHSRGTVTMTCDEFVNLWLAKPRKTSKKGTGALYLDIYVEGVKYNVSVVEDFDKKDDWKYQVERNAKLIMRSEPDYFSEDDAMLMGLLRLAEYLKLPMDA